MKIVQVEIIPFEPRFSGDGYAMSHVVQKVLYGRLIRLTTEDGQFGVGEIVRKSRLDPAETSAVEDAALLALDGIAIADLPGLLNGWRERGLPLLALVFGVELAMLDLIGRNANMPLSALLGGPRTGSVGAYLSLSAEAPENMARLVRARSGYPVVQAKLGIDDIDTDMRRVEAVLGAMAPDQKLLADFNGALKPGDALRALPAIRDPRLTWEDPCLAYDDLADVARGLDAPVMFDMCMDGTVTFLRAIRDGVAASLVIKPPFVGGVSVARTLRDLCIAARIPFRVDGPWSGPLAAASAIHLALGVPEDLLICSADLTDPFDDDYALIRHPAPGQIAAAKGLGLGPIPKGLFP